MPHQDEWDDEAPLLGPPYPEQVISTENPIVAELLGPDGTPIRQWRERPPVGFQLPRRTSSRMRGKS